MVQSVREQYASSANLESRISIYKYGTNPMTFSKWLVEQIKAGNHVKILELGCGTGELWLDLKGSFPNCDILLSDFSAGMLDKAVENLGQNDFSFETEVRRSGYYSVKTKACLFICSAKVLTPTPPSRYP